MTFSVDCCSSKSADPPVHRNHQNTREESYETQNSDHMNRIVNGDDARPGQFPYQVGNINSSLRSNHHIALKCLTDSF